MSIWTRDEGRQRRAITINNLSASCSPLSHSPAECLTSCLWLSFSPHLSILCSVNPSLPARSSWHNWHYGNMKYACNIQRETINNQTNKRTALSVLRQRPPLTESENRDHCLWHTHCLRDSQWANALWDLPTNTHHHSANVIMFN